jgi:hypothetical protein
MTNAETLAKVILDIEVIIAAYLEPGPEQDPKLVIEEILTAMDTNDAIGAAEQIESGGPGPLVK